MKALEFVQSRGIVTSKELQEIGLYRCYMTPMCAEGLLVRVGHGLYRAANTTLPGIPTLNESEEQRVLGGAPNATDSPTDVSLSGAHPFIEALRIVPHGTIGLLSALHHHGLLAESPREVWLLLHPFVHRPKKPPIPLQMATARGESLPAGIERHVIDGVSVPITDPAKTIADCFKYPRKVPVELAAEALAAGLRTGKATVAQIMHYATLCRVRGAIWPYLKPFVPQREAS